MRGKEYDDDHDEATHHDDGSSDDLDDGSSDDLDYHYAAFVVIRSCLRSG